jgi:anti-anti-sigma regulatory factor
MKKKVSKKNGASTALGHDPLAWIDAEDNEEVQAREANNVEPQADAQQEASIIETSEATAPEVVAEPVTAESLGTKKEPAEDESISGRKVLCLEESLGIAQVETFHQVLLDIINQATEIEVDTSALQQIDGAGVQLLYVFIHDAEAKGIKVGWKGTSEALQKSAKQLGLLEDMGLA